MAIRIVRMDSGKTIGTCACGDQRESGAPDPQTAEQEINRLFEGHKCPLNKPREDVNQAAARVVREATEKF